MPERDHVAAHERIAALEGVRALAITAVFVYHLGAPWLPGGFLGVDVFFVLSGFLITRLLLRESSGTGRVDLAGFWLRRARRLLPAVLALLAVIAVYAATRPADQKLPLRQDLVSSLFYVANWQFVAEGRSYFSEFQAPSPLRHLWSLAIEEQFYLVFPVLVVAALAVIRRFRRRGRLLVAVTVIIAFAGSVASLGFLYEESDPSRAYYSTHTRLHELLSGVGLAVLIPVLAKRGAALARPLAYGGLAALVVLFALVDDRGPVYYHGGSLAVSVASAALVGGLALRPDSGVVARLMSSRPAVAAGTTSYSLYLWHWPVIAILTPESIGVSGPFLVGVHVAVSVVLSVLSYKFVETPVRRGSIKGFRLGAARVFPIAGAALIALSAAAFSGTSDAKPEPDYVRQSEGLIVPRGADPRRPVIGLVGDSIAASLQRALAEEARAYGHTLVSAARPGCGIGSSLLLDETGHPFARAATCAERTPRLQDELVRRYHPRVVLWHSARDRTDARVDGRILKAGSAEWTRHRYADWDAALGRLVREGARVMLLLPAWSASGSGGSSCGGEFNLDPAGCGRAFVTTEHLRRLYTDWAQKNSNYVTVMDLGRQVCPSGPPCPDKVGNISIRDDDVHFSSSGAHLVAPHIVRAALTALDRAKGSPR
ncbi:acyltransferase family protein [Sphaerisporangium album]|uniref:acyltransferase family protein n=1 Tax=Sphaerisporangium album TaxID=509200 RepID=UPI0015F0B35F|nr:acyltransferase family protein [Sphaerisporangium album]